MTIENASAKVITTLLRSRMHIATMYLSDKLTIRATRTRYRTKSGKPRAFHATPLDIRLTIGKPNYTARQFIKLAKRAGEPFPITRVQTTTNWR